MTRQIIPGIESRDHNSILKIGFGIVVGRIGISGVLAAFDPHKNDPRPLCRKLELVRRKRLSGGIDEDIDRGEADGLVCGWREDTVVWARDGCADERENSKQQNCEFG